MLHLQLISHASRATHITLTTCHSWHTTVAPRNRSSPSMLCQALAMPRAAASPCVRVRVCACAGVAWIDLEMEPILPWASEAEASASPSLRQPASRPQASEEGEEVGAARGKGKGRQESSVGGMGSMLCVSQDASLRVVDMSSRQQVSPAASLTSRASSLSSPPASHFMTQTKACVGGTQALPQRPRHELPSRCRQCMCGQRRLLRRGGARRERALKLR
jgi:hypothetical protein